ncbi:hypothetical protein V1291_003588 [Nitrobacteraceae bacterium AZCC 1564]
MVKESKAKSGPRRGPMPNVDSDGPRRGKRGPEPRPGDAKTDRIIMRVHPDLLEVIDARAREKDLTRSKYLNQVLVGWSNADPRNPRLDAAGRRIETVLDPRQSQLSMSASFVERWQRYVAAHNAIFGHPPPSSWFDELDERDQYASAATPPKER